MFGEPSTPYYQTWSIALGLLLLAWLVLSGKLGRSFRAVRDAELAAVSSGLNPAVFKTLAFGIAAAYAGIAGALLAIQLGSVNYLTFVPLLSITLLVGAAIGGFSALSGTIVGALFIVYAPLKAEDFSKKDWWSTLHLPNPEQAPSVLYGLFLLGLLFLMPGGAAQLFGRIRPALETNNKTGVQSSYRSGGNYPDKERVMKKAALGVLAVAAALTFGLTGAFGGAQATPGVTAKLITIGGTFPLTGAASSYTPIARGMQAFFSYTNATRGPDKKKGIGGRQIKFIVEDDGYNPVQTVAKTRKLVEQDHVLATVGALGTEPQQAVREYMNSKKVPQLWVSTGATFWGARPGRLPVVARLAA